MKRKSRHDPRFYDELVMLVGEEGKTKGLTRGPQPPDFPPRPIRRVDCEPVSELTEHKKDKPSI